MSSALLIFCISDITRDFMLIVLGKDGTMQKSIAMLFMLFALVIESQALKIRNTKEAS